MYMTQLATQIQYVRERHSLQVANGIGGSAAVAENVSQAMVCLVVSTESGQLVFEAPGQCCIDLLSSPRLSEGMRRPVSSGMRYAPID